MMLFRLPHRRHAGAVLGIPLVVGVLLLVSACGDTASPAAGSSSGATTASPAGGGGADNGTGEQAGVTYQSSRYHYRVDAPGQVTEASDGSVSAQRGVESLRISVVTGAAGADPQTFAQTDVARVQSNTQQFQVVNALASAKLGGRSVVKIVYSSTGTNAVTGKSESLVNARYYIPRDGSTLAVLTYSIVDRQYDPQGADDVAATFSWQ